MRGRLLLASLILNVALGTGWFVASRAHRASITTRLATNTNFPETVTNYHTHVVMRRQSFSWQEVESGDYLSYIANLRDIGCPETTIRDIIIADVNQLFARKRLTEIVTPDQQWWRSDPDPELVARVQQKAEALDAERKALLDRLLGDGWETNDSLQKVANTAGIQFSGPVLSRISPENQRLVLDITSRSVEATQNYLKDREAHGLPAEPAELARLREQTRTELEKVLTPAELEEYLLRYSYDANQLRDQLRGFNTTPDEFRAIFRATDSIDRQMQLNYADDSAASVQQRQLLAQQRELAIKNVLSPERYRSYVYNKDPVFREVQATAQEIGAAPNSVVAFYEIRQATSAEAQRIKTDSTLTPEEQFQALQTVQEAELNSLRQVLGEDAYQRYLKERLQ